MVEKVNFDGESSFTARGEASAVRLGAFRAAG